MSAPVEALVVGGGLAGAGIATLLAGAGREVVLIERSTGPHDKVCGEFLSHEAAFYLSGLGIDLPVLGAVPINRVRLHAGTASAGADLPFRGASLSRRVLDEALLRRAASAGAVIRRGRRAASLERRGDAWRLRLEDGEIISARDVFLATGKHDLRGWPRPAGWQGDLVGFKQHFRLAPGQSRDLAGRVALVLFDGGYAGIEPVEDGIANLCLLVRRRRLDRESRSWDRLLAALEAECPTLADRFDGAVPLTRKPLAAAALPYGHVRHRSDGLWRLGDQAAVIPSFSGDGMSMALHSAHLAARCYLGGESADVFQRRFGADVAGSVRLATGLSHALVRPATQRALTLAGHIWPGLVTRAARATRVPDRALSMVG